MLTKSKQKAMGQQCAAFKCEMTKFMFDFDRQRIKFWADDDLPKTTLCAHCYGCLIGPCIGYSVLKWSSNQHHRNDWTIDPNPNLVDETWTNECVSRTCLRISFWMRATFYHHALFIINVQNHDGKNNGNDAVKNGVCGQRIVNCIVCFVFI